MNIVSQMLNEWNFKLSLNIFICENAFESFIWKFNLQNSSHFYQAPMC